MVDNTVLYTTDGAAVTVEIDVMVDAVALHVELTAKFISVWEAKCQTE